MKSLIVYHSKPDYKTKEINEALKNARKNYCVEEINNIKEIHNSYKANIIILDHPEPEELNEAEQFFKNNPDISFIITRTMFFSLVSQSERFENVNFCDHNQLEKILKRISNKD